MSKAFIASIMLTGLVTYIAIPDAHAVSASQIKRHVEQTNRQKTSIYNKDMQATYQEQESALGSSSGNNIGNNAPRSRYRQPEASVDRWQNADQQQGGSYQQPSFTPNRGSSYGGSSSGGSPRGSSGSKQNSGGNMWGF